MYDFRKPSTTTSSDFWYISQERWDNYLGDVELGGTNRTSALNQLRKFDAAGRIMETDEGKPAPTPCSWCMRRGSQAPCRIYSKRNDTACAFCKRMGKAGCTAAIGDQAGEEQVNDHDKSGLQEQVNNLASENQELGARIETLEREVANIRATFRYVDELRRIAYAGSSFRSAFDGEEQAARGSRSTM